MALIKATAGDRLLREAMVLDFSDLGMQAERIIARAKQQASEILGEAEAEARRLIAGADERGYAEGRARGEAEGRAAGEASARAEEQAAYRGRLEMLSTRWMEALERWETERREMYLEAKADVARFAVEVARKVIRKEVEVDGSIVQDQIASALALLSRPTSVRVRVNPGDAKLSGELMPRLKEQMGTCEHLGLVEDATVERGGCVVQTAGGSVDARIESQMERIAEAVVEGRLKVNQGERERREP